jgi:hypothetical protein
MNGLVGMLVHTASSEIRFWERCPYASPELASDALRLFPSKSLVHWPHETRISQALSYTINSRSNRLALG